MRRTIHNNFTKNCAPQNNNACATNPILANNPNFNATNQNFAQRMNMAKMDRPRATTIKELGVDNSELIKYVIAPIQLGPVSNEEKDKMMSDYNNQDGIYTILKNYNPDTKIKTNAPNTIKEYFQEEKKNNMPYKRVLHNLDINEYYTKKAFKSQQDLLIYRTTQNDKTADVKKLDTELNKLKKTNDDHDEEIEQNKDKNKEECTRNFEFANKHRHTIKYNPKDCSELKDLYKKEHKALYKEAKRADNMLNMFLATEDISKEDLDEINKLKEKEEEISNSYRKNLELLEQEEIKQMRRDEKKHVDPNEEIIVTKKVVKKEEQEDSRTQSLIDRYKKRA
jgi:hypothetical protein